MSSDLYIWMPDDETAPWPWVTSVGLQGVAETDLEKSALASRNFKDIIVILAGQSVRILPLDLPDMREKDRLSAARFSLETEIAGPLSRQHIVLSGEQPARAGVITHDKMEAILKALSLAGLDPVKIAADFDIVSQLSSPLHLDDRIIIPGPFGYTLDTAWASETENRVDASQLDLTHIMTRLDIEGALNFRQGQFARRRSFGLAHLGDHSQGLISVAGLLVVLGVSWLGLQLSQMRAIHHQATVIQQDMKALYTRTTGEPAPANVALTVTRAIPTSADTDADFMHLSSVLFTALSSVEGVELDTVQYDRDDSALVLRLIYSDFDQASAVERSVAQNGGLFRSGGIRDRGDRFVGDARLSLRAGT